MFTDTSFDPPRRQRVAAYAVIRRLGPAGEEVLLSQLSPSISPSGVWTLPGGGLDFGEHPRDGVVREVFEETGLHATVGEIAWVDSATRVVTALDLETPVEMQSLRTVFEGWVREDSPEPSVQEIDGSTVAAAWHLVADIRAGLVATVPMVLTALDKVPSLVLQRLSAYAVIRREDALLLTRISDRGHHPGAWTLPGGGVDHGETPRDTVRREVHEETGLEVEPGELLGVHDVSLVGRAPSGRLEDYHGVHLLFAASVRGDAEPRVVEVGGTTDAVAWVPVAEIESGTVPVLEVVRAALDPNHLEP